MTGVFCLKDILKCLFPELQVIEYTKKTGFINKTAFKKENENIKQKINNSYAGRGSVSSGAKEAFASKSNVKENLVHNFNSAVQGAENTFEEAKETSASVGSKINSEIKRNLSSNRSVQGVENKKDLDSIFDEVEKELGCYVLGQKEFLSKLCIAFKRSFLLGETEGILNMFFISGPKGSGRHLSLKGITSLLRKYNVLNQEGINEIDMSQYTSKNDVEKLFIPDLYKAICSYESCIVINNYDKAAPEALDILVKVGIDEKLVLTDRYKEQMGKMINTTGSLELDTTNIVNINGKFLVFVTEQNEKTVKAAFPQKFVEKIYDFAEAKSLSDEVLGILALASLKDCKKKIMENLKVELSFDKGVGNTIVNNINKKNGAPAIKDFIEMNVYNTMVDLVLNKRIYEGNNYSIICEDNKLKLLCGNNKYDLVSKSYKSGEGLEVLDKEMDKIIGLQSVKDFIKGLKDNVKIQSARQKAGQNAAKLSLHMIFTGNPGTGKTTMARIVAKYLKALGYLSSGHLVETSRNDFVGQYVGETAEKTTKKINSAKGGILFIDEAYSLCRDKNDVFGIEAVDTIVKAVEDMRDDFVVILAGYSDEMANFLEMNSGLKSRFNYIVDFPDYTPEDLFSISKGIAKGNGYEITDECNESLLKLFKNKQIKGKNDSGNGRLARNVVEKAIANQSKRLISENISDEKELSLLKLSDFSLKNEVNFNIEEELNKVIGLQNVKDFVIGLKKQLVAEQKRKSLGIDVNSEQSLNMIFTGNPGTGKTTVARLISKLMMEMGILKSDVVIETDRSGLVGEFTGETTKKTKKVFMSALGGVLFIDEAYALMSSSNDPYGKEAVDTLVKLIEDHKNDIIVILAGYDKEMKEFLNTNSGLKSRFPLNINFPDYNIEELFEIAKSMILSKKFKLDISAEESLKELIEMEKAKSGANSGNGRMVRNIVEDIIRKQSLRIADLETIRDEDAVLITKDDLGVSKASKNDFNLEESLKKIVGVSEVKNFIRGLEAEVKIKNKRKAAGLETDDTQTLHMVFKGNPGTGKTTMARIVGEVLYNLGVLKSKKLVETDRSGLVAGYVGQTAIKTKEKIEEALGGILFIDEAYALANDASSGGFGKEAIDTLVKGIDDNRDNLLVILAGYDDNMDDFLEVNPGLKSRFPNVIEFADYSVEELLSIADIMFKEKGYEPSPKAREKMSKIFEAAINKSDFGNGRYVRNLLEKAVRNQALRLGDADSLTKEQLTKIEEEDIESI